MPGQAINSNRKPYLKIIAGNFMQPSKAGEAGSVLREYELPNGSKGSKWEIPFMNWEAKIIGITFKESEYGETCNIELDDAFIQLNIEGRYFQDLACKLFSADLSKPILLHPYDMTIDDKKRTGVSVQQGGVKLKNYFFDGTKNLHGFPEVDQVKKAKKSYWKMYFAEVAEFLVEKLKELKFEKPTQIEAAEEVFGESVAGNVEHVTPDDLPF